MLAYAWRHLDSELLEDVDRADAGDWAELLGILLSESAERALRVAAPCSYRMEQVSLRGIRGRIDVPRFAQARATGDNRFPCIADLLTIDCRTNRVIKAAALMLARSTKVCPETACRLLRVAELLRDVDAHVDVASLRRSNGRPHRNGAHALACFVAELVLNQEAPTTAGDLSAVAGWPTSPQALGALFQDFLKEYWTDTSSVGQRVTAHQKLQIDAAPTTRQLAEILPEFRSDITLSRKGLTAIVEAKFMAPLVPSFRGTDDKLKIRSEHISQLLCYLLHARVRSPDDRFVGLLVYPRDSASLRARFRVYSFEMCVATVNLFAPWQEVLAELRAIRESLETAHPLGLGLGESVAICAATDCDEGEAAEPVPPMRSPEAAEAWRATP